MMTDDQRKKMLRGAITVLAVSLTAGWVCFSSGKSSWGDDGILVSGSTTSVKAEARSYLNQRMNDYVQQVVIQSVLTKTGEVFNRVLSGQNIQIFPQVAYQAIEQAALQLFKQESTSQTLREAYTTASDKTMTLLDEDASASVIQQQVRSSVNEVIGPVFQGPLFKAIVEEVLKSAITQSQRIIAATLMQRQAQVAAIQKQRQMLQMALLQQVQKSMIMQQQQVAAQMNQRAAQYQQGVQQEARQLYDQKLQALQEEMRLKYDEAVLKALSGAK